MFQRVYIYATVCVLGILVHKSCLGKEEGERRTQGKLQRRVVPPSYAVPMEPLVQYSQRDPLYHQRQQSSNVAVNKQSDSRDTRRVDENPSPERSFDRSRDRYDNNGYYPPPSYYEQPEPIIEIIIKESNVTLPTTPPPPLPPVTKEPIHVFYVKYKKNPNPKGKNDRIIYDAPIPALVPHSSEIKIGEEIQHKSIEATNYNTPPTTTLRTIIRPESETFHGSGIKVTFGKPEETEIEEGTEQKPRIALPPDSRYSESNLLPSIRPNEAIDGHYQFHQPQQPGLVRPTQIFNSQPQELLQPPGAHLTGSLRGNSFQNTKYPPLTDEQIRQYQEEKLHLYRESLKQQNALPPPSISPIVPPQRFQQPTSNPPSQLQINFNQQKHQLQLQQEEISRHHHQQELKRTNYPIPSSGSLQFQQKPYYNDYRLNLNTYGGENQNSRVPDPVGHGPENIYDPIKTRNPNYEKNSANPILSGIIGGVNKQTSIQQGINVFEKTIVSHETQQTPHFNTRPQPSSNLHLTRPQEQSEKSSFTGGEIFKSVAQLEEHQVTPDYRNEYYSFPHEPPKRNKLPQSQDPLQFYPVYSTTAQATQKQFSSGISTTAIPPLVPTTEKNVPLKIQQTEEMEHYDTSSETPYKKKKNETALKVNIAALPAEVPEDLRAQLLSSGILSNADIQILDYDKVGDIPIESLPPEALEQFHSAASDPVPSVVKPENDRTSMKHYDSLMEKGVNSYIKKIQNQIATKTTKDNKYNRYLPLKVNGSQFSLGDDTEIKGRVIKSVVVLAPVEYDSIKGNDEKEERVGKAIQVEGVRFIAGEALKDLVKNPIRQNFNKWLEQEKNAPTRHQSVILLITRKEGQTAKSSNDIFMYDINTATISKLRGELSQTFVEVAESNSSNQDLDGIDNE